MGEALFCIKKYQRMYKRVIKGSKKKKRERERETMIGMLQNVWTEQKPCGS
jgi:hypothetical protein